MLQTYMNFFQIHKNLMKKIMYVHEQASVAVVGANKINVMFFYRRNI